MKLSPPKVITWWVALVLGVLGLLGFVGVVAGLGQYAFWLVAAGLALMLVATLVRTSSRLSVWTPGMRIGPGQPGGHVYSVGTASLFPRS